MLRPAALSLVLTAPVLFSGSFHATPQPQFRSRALAVRVDVLVTDRRNPVGGLTAADFELRDNGIVQKIDSLDTADAPLNIVLTLDTSASVEGQRYADLAAATERLLEGLRPADRAALITFDHAVMPRSGLSADIDAVRRQLARVEPSGQTSMLDGVYVALTTTLPEPGRSLVVVFTDGDDVSSWLEGREVADSAARSNAVIYAVTSARRREQRVLEQLTSVTGGDVLRVASTEELGGAFERILRTFRSRYVLSYTPSGVNIGGFHRLDVRTKRRGLSVKARPGYIGVESPK